MIDNIKEITTIITEEFDCDYYNFRNHNSSYSTVEFAGLEIHIKNDISPQDFRVKVAEAFLDRIEHLLKVEQGRLLEKERTVRNLNKIYNHYHDIVKDIAVGRVESLEVINWKTHKKLMY